MLRALSRRLKGGHEVRHLSSHTKSRQLTASEALGALRPFYLAVHPDLFSRYPREKAANEEALKCLHSYLESLNNAPSSPPPLPQLTFFLRRHNAQSGMLKSVDIPLPLTHSLAHAVHTILHSCGLLDHVSDETRARLRLAGQSESPASANWNSGHVFEDLDLEKWEDMFAGDSRDTYRPLMLDEWLKEYAPVARVANEHSQPIREENMELMRELCAYFGAGGVHCGIGWTAATLRGYLHGLRSVLEREREVWGEVVERWRRGGMSVRMREGGGGGVVREEGWKEGEGEEGGPVLVVGHGSGVDVHGRICFSCEDTPQQWAQYLQSLREPLLTLYSLSQLEQQVMAVFRGVEVVRPVNVCLADYHEWVGRVVRGCEGSVGWDVVLGEEVEEERGRSGGRTEACWIILMITRPRPGSQSGLPSLSPEGVVQVPASCPAQRLAMFLQTHHHAILQRRAQYNRLKSLAESALLRSRDHLGLSSLTAQPSLSSQKVVEGCQRLTETASNPHNAFLRDGLAGQQLCLGQYYLVSGDGELTVPWNFQTSAT